MDIAPPHDDMTRFFRADVTLDAAAVRDWLLALRGRPHVPGSDYDVGAVLRASFGGRNFYFAGINVENGDYNIAMHGEGTALSMMATILGPGARLEEAWIMGAPRALQAGSSAARAAQTGSCCGRCRQHLSEWAAGPDVPVHSLALNGAVRTFRMAELLPEGFSFAHYKPEATAARLEAAAQSLPPLDILHARLCRPSLPDDPAAAHEWLASLRGVPYASGIERAVILRLDNGACVAGVGIEDAAFTGINAAQGASALAVLLHGMPVRIRHVYALGHTPGGDLVPADGLVPLSLAAVQVLREWADGDCGLTLFTPSGVSYRTTLDATAHLPARSLPQPFYRLQNGQPVA